MFSATLARRLAAAVKSPSPSTITSATNSATAAAAHPNRSSPYKLKKDWPPDYSRLSPQAKLRYEKKYKRRVALMAERPRWNKYVRLAQLFSVTFVVFYSVLWMKWDDERHNPFFQIKKRFWEMFGYEVSLDTNAAAQSSRERPEFNKNPR